MTLFLQLIVSKGDSTNTNKKSKPLTPPATIKGDLKMVVADQKLLEKLGFRFEYLPEYKPDSIWQYGCLPYSVYYNNLITKNEALSESNNQLVFSMKNRIEGEASFSNSIYFQEIEINDSVSFINLSFYPNIVSYPSGFVRFNLCPDNFNFEMANDTLFPIFVPTQTISNDPNNWVLWFNITDSLIALLPKSVRTQTENIQNNKILKKEFPSLDFKVFPNPANQQTTVTFSLPKAISGRISLVDLAGRERQVLLPETSLTKGFHRFEFDLSGVSEKMYLITLYSDQGIQVQRLMVSH